MPLTSGISRFLGSVLRASYTLGAGSNLLFVVFTGDPVRNPASGVLPQAIDDVRWVRWGNQDLLLGSEDYNSTRVDCRQKSPSMSVMVMFTISKTPRQARNRSKSNADPCKILSVPLLLITVARG